MNESNIQTQHTKAGYPAIELPDTLKADVSAFNENVASYQVVQERFIETRRENERLITAATALEAEAAEINTRWKALTKERKVDQRNINGLIAREVELKMNAESLRKTAEIREELVREYAVDMAGARLELSNRESAIKRAYVDFRISAAFDDEYFSAQINEIFSGCMTKTADEYAMEDGSGRPSTTNAGNTEIEMNAWRIFIEKTKAALQSQVKQTQKPSFPVTMPPTTAGEIVALTPIALANLKKAGGIMPSSDGFPLAKSLVQK